MQPNRPRGKPNSLRRKLQQLDCDGVSSKDRQLGVSVTGAVPKLARRISMQRPDFLPISPPETASRRIPQPGDRAYRVGAFVNKIAWWQRGVIYQVYPRSFQDTND